MAKKKKEIEPIVIQKTELIPTTIGLLETKESGPLFAVVWVLIFILAIVGLPYITSLINNQEIPEVTTPSETKPNTPDPTVANKEANLYDFNENTTFEFEGFVFSEWQINDNQLQFLITNKTGKSNLFAKNNYYVELYNDENTLLQRLKMEKSEIAGSKLVTFNITVTEIKKVSIVLKEEKDYPQITLKTDTDNNPYLVCSLNNEKLTYYFTEKDNVYSLQKMNESYSFSSSEEDYDRVLANYTSLVTTYRGLSGIEASLTPIKTGFSFEATIDFENITTAERNKVLKKTIYYAPRTEARVISFELEASGYNCE